MRIHVKEVNDIKSNNNQVLVPDDVSHFILSRIVLYIVPIACYTRKLHKNSPNGCQHVKSVGY